MGLKIIQKIYKRGECYVFQRVWHNTRQFNLVLVETTPWKTMDPNSKNVLTIFFKFALKN